MIIVFEDGKGRRLSALWRKLTIGTRARKIWTGIEVVVVALAVVAAMWIWSPDDGRLKVQEQRIRTVVNVGMNIDEAARILRSNGFSVTDKYRPTSDNYYVCVVRLDVPSRLDLIKDMLGIGKPRKIYLTIRSDENGKIEHLD